jgi:hypothetical protein
MAPSRSCVRARVAAMARRAAPRVKTWRTRDTHREAPGVARAERFRVLGLQLREPLLEPALLLVGGQAALAPELLRVALDALLAAGRRGVVPGVAAGPARQRDAAAHDLTREAVI